MRRLPIVILFPLLAAIGARPAPAQGFGLNGGLNLSDVFGDAVQSSSTRTGLTAGGAMTLLTLGPVSIGPEIYYAQKGAEEAVLQAESPEFYEQFGLNYLEVPVLARVGIPILPGWLRGYVQGGPAFAWNLNCNIERGNDGTTALNEECELAQFQNGSAAIRSADQGLVLGGGLSLNLFNQGNINLDARLVRGLARVAEGAGGPDIRNQAVSLMLGYSLGW